MAEEQKRKKKTKTTQSRQQQQQKTKRRTTSTAQQGTKKKQTKQTKQRRVAGLTEEEKQAKKEALELVEKQKDPTTGEQLPRYADGLTPGTAQNTSPLDPGERLKIKGLGNKEGQKAALKAKFDDVKERKDGRFAVKDGDVWKMVDPKGLGAADPWELTQGIVQAATTPFNPTGKKNDVAEEILSDTADIAPELGLGLGSLATGGSLSGLAAVGGGTELARTSLGRLAGTYQESPEQQVEDVAWETFFNVAIPGAPKGAKKLFQAGKKATPKMIADGLEKSANVTKKASGGAKKAIADVVGKVTGTGDDELLRNLERPRAVAKKIREFSKNTNSTSEAIDAATKRTTKSLESLAREADNQLEEFYKKGMRSFIERMPSGFKFKGKEALRPVFERLQGAGVGKIGDDGLFQMNKFDDIVNAGQRNELTNELANNPQAFKTMRDTVKLLNDQAKASVAGKEGANAARVVDKTIRNQINKVLKPKAFNKGFNTTGKTLKQVVDDFDSGFDDHMTKQLQGNAEALTTFRNTKNTYRQLKNEFDPIVGTLKQGIKSDQVSQKFASLANKLFGGAGKQPVSKEAMRLVEKRLGGKGKRIQRLIDDVNDSRAASAVMPFGGGVVTQFGLVGGATLATGQPEVMALALGVSPRAVGGVTRLSGRLPKATSQFMANQSLKGLSFLNSIRANGKMGEFLANPDAVNSFLDGSFNPRNVDGEASKITNQSLEEAIQRQQLKQQKKEQEQEQEQGQQKEQARSQ